MRFTTLPSAIILCPVRIQARTARPLLPFSLATPPPPVTIWLVDSDRLMRERWWLRGMARRTPETSRSLPALPVLTLSSGGSGTATITTSVVNGFSGTIALTCSVSSSLGATTCSLNPTSVSVGTASTLTINGATLTGRLEKPGRHAPGPWGIESSFLFAAVLIVPWKRKPRHGVPRARYRVSALLSLMLLGLVMVLTSCGGGSGSSSGPTPLSGTVTVTATSGSLSHTAQVAVTIN